MPSSASTTRRRELPGHLSHSSRETLERCAKSWFLKYLTPAPRRQATWLVGGSAVHAVTEAWDKGTVPAGQVTEAWEYAFNGFLAEARAKEPNEFKWAQSKAEPVEVWRSMGPGLVQAYIDWRERSPWEIWTTPAGEPAIELDVSGYLPGCPVEIKGFIDRIFWDPVFEKRPILDIKSGKKAPSDPAQFGVYQALFKAKYGLDLDYGVFFMNRKGTPGKPYDLADFTPEAVGAAFGEAWARIQAGEFPAEAFERNDCFLCDVQESCAAKGGPLAHRYDPDHPGYTPF